MLPDCGGRVAGGAQQTCTSSITGKPRDDECGAAEHGDRWRASWSRCGSSAGCSQHDGSTFDAQHGDVRDYGYSMSMVIDSGGLQGGSLGRPLYVMYAPFAALDETDENRTSRVRN